MGLGGQLQDINHLYSTKGKATIEIVSVTAAAVSVLACLISLYWFLLLQRNFRRTLIMLLLISDLWKSFWFMAMPAVSLARGGIKTGSDFCNVGGFFLQVGLEACDFVILAMAVHMTLQVFHANNKYFGSEGLHRVRYAVFALWISVPAFMSALAFVNNTQGAYLSQGAFCSLPIRPFWYRLALSWIPRYMVWAFVTFTAIRVYRHVGSGFQMFARQVDVSSTNDAPSRYHDNPNSLLPTINVSDTAGSQKDESNIMVTDLASYERRPSAIRIAEANSRPNHGQDSGTQLGACNLQTHMATHNSSQHDRGSRYGSVADTMGAGTTSRKREIVTPAQLASQRRRAIRRQVRLLFIYPFVYMIMLIVPFISHCFNYSDYWAQHPSAGLGTASTFFFASMGAADCIVFVWREQPWKHISGSDGTFLGSFRFWKIFGLTAENRATSRVTSPASSRRPSQHVVTNEKRPSTADSARKIIAALRPKRAAPRRIFSGTTDRAVQDAESAAQRLELEREEHLANKAASMYTKSNPTSPIKEWFDRPMSFDFAEETDGTDVRGSSKESIVKETV